MDKTMKRFIKKVTNKMDDLLNAVQLKKSDTCNDEKFGVILDDFQKVIN